MSIEDYNIHAERIVGNAKPSGFPEYDSLTGYLERTYTVEWEDSSGTRWRKTCQVINLGRPDRGVVVPPDDEQDDNTDAVERLRQEKLKRDQATLDQLQQILTERGPLSSYKLAKILKRGRFGLVDLMRYRSDVFEHRQKPSSCWALVGQPVEERSYVSPVVEDVRRVLIEHGPMIGAHIADHVGRSRPYVSELLNKHKDVFAVHGMDKEKHKNDSRRWCVVGVHDTEGAA
jgi:hypothetical protein